MKDLVEQKMGLIYDNKSKYKEEILKGINMKLYRLKIIQPRAFKLTLSKNIDEVQSIFKENIDRVSKFIDAFINPNKLFEFIDKINEHPKIKEQVINVRTLDELQELIITTIVYKPFGEEYKIVQNEPKDRITAKWNTDFTAGTGQEESIYSKNDSGILLVNF
jgi:hypothetical protein